MGIFRLQRVFSSGKPKDWDAEDDDYVDDIRKRYREERSQSSWGNPLGLGASGALIGGMFGPSKGIGKRALIGGAIGAGLGAAWHKGFVKPHTKELEESEIKKYQDIQDKEGRRRKIDRDEANKARRDAGRYAGRYGSRQGIYGGW